MPGSGCIFSPSWTMRSISAFRSASGCRRPASIATMNEPCMPGRQSEISPNSWLATLNWRIDDTHLVRLPFGVDDLWTVNSGDHTSECVVDCAHGDVLEICRGHQVKVFLFVGKSERCTHIKGERCLFTTGHGLHDTAATAVMSCCVRLSGEQTVQCSLARSRWDSCR